MPAALTTVQRNAVAQFMHSTNTDRHTAARQLKAANWNVPQAVNNYLVHSHSKSSAAISGNQVTMLHCIFDKFTKRGAQRMDIQSTQAYFKALNVSIEDASCLIASYIVQSPSLGEITREGFIDGWSEKRCFSIEEQKALISRMHANLASLEMRGDFERIYAKTFPLMIQQTGQRVVDKATCIETWKIIFSPPSVNWRTARVPWLDLWIKFLESEDSIKSINRDVWTQTLKFAKQAMADDKLQFWSEDQSWPSIIDQFVQWAKEHANVGASEGGATNDVMEL